MINPKANDVLRVANFFLDKAREDNIKDISNLKINKLAYISYGFCLAYNIKLFNDAIEAWHGGAVVPILYHVFKKYGADPIKEHASITNFQNDIISYMTYPRFHFAPKEEKDCILQAVWNTYKDVSALELRDITRSEGTPWANTKINSNIADEDIKKYYVNFINEKFS